MRRATESAEESGSGVPEGTIPRPRFRDRLWGFGAMVVGLAMLLSAGRVGNHALRQSEWSSSEGTVTAAHLSSRTKGSSGGTWISAVHRYSYEVADILYQADRYSWGSVGGSSPAAADELSPGDTVAVWYAPYAPDVAVLVREKPGKSVWLFALIGLVLAVQGARKAHRPSP